MRTNDYGLPVHSNGGRSLTTFRFAACVRSANYLARWWRISRPFWRLDTGVAARTPVPYPSRKRPGGLCGLAADSRNDYETVKHQRSTSAVE
jgi:hypothetical protein